jgi:hypothetical protein
MLQRNQWELNLGTGTTGEARSTAAQETEARAARVAVESPTVGVWPSMEAILSETTCARHWRKLNATREQRASMV